MLFNSIQYLIFFPIVVGLYFAIPHRYRWVLLLGASYYFYMSWKPEYIILIIISTLIDYYAGLQMGRTADKAKRKRFLILSLLSNLGILFGFKYFNFFNDSLRTIFNQFNIFYNVPAFEVLLPVGISFYTFQTLSYSIDVYRGQKKPETHLGIFALYVAFFPQLVAGPIERSTQLLPQFYKQYEFDYQRVTDGLKLMAWGFFKKIVIADRLAVVVDTVYNNPTEHTGIPLIIATYFFAFQIYCDFSGYSDIAIGSAQILGFDLMQNFRQPYFAKSVAEFWQRWHISLSTWFRDYLYIPLGGNRVSQGRWYSNLMIVFLVSGLWHGANWTFVIWGGLHGLYLLCSLWTKSFRAKIGDTFQGKRLARRYKYVQVLITFHLVVFAWIFFRANSVTDAIYIASNLLHFSLQPIDIGLSTFELIVVIMAILIMEFVHLVQREGSARRMLATQPVWFRWSVYYALVFSILMFGKFGINEFIYFQF